MRAATIYVHCTRFRILRAPIGCTAFKQVRIDDYSTHSSFDAQISLHAKHGTSHSHEPKPNRGPHPKFAAGQKFARSFNKFEQPAWPVAERGTSGNVRRQSRRQDEEPACARQRQRIFKGTGGIRQTPLAARAWAIDSPFCIISMCYVSFLTT